MQKVAKVAARGAPAAASRTAKAAASKPAATPQPRLTKQSEQLLQLAALKQETAQQRQALTEAEAKLSEALAEGSAAAEREQSLVTLCASAGLDTISLGPINWSTAQAKSLLEEEAAHDAALDAMLGKVQRNSEAVRQMIGSQQELQLKLAPLAAAAAVSA